MVTRNEWEGGITKRKETNTTKRGKENGEQGRKRTEETTTYDVLSFLPCEDRDLYYY
jgi:hypothetical protein